MKCQQPECDKKAEFEIYDTNERRPDMTGVAVCEDHVGSQIGSVPPTEPTGPWTIHAV